jgi:membrane fusion protein (multidrug efflux system)
MTRRFSLAVATMALSACAPEAPPPGLVDALAPDAGAARVEVAKLRATDTAITVRLPGEIAGAKDALLASALGGLVETVRVDEGDVVRKGQPLVEIDEDLYAAQLDQAEAQLALAREELARTEKMGDLATGSELSGRKAQAAVAEAQARIARTQLDRATIRAPFDGTVGGIAVEQGEMAAPGAPVVRLVQLDPLVVSLSVSDRDVVALREGLDARVSTSASAGVRNGKVSSIAPVADLSTRSFMVEVEVANPDGGLLPGMIAQVEVEREVADGRIALPQDWVVTRLDGYGVFVVTDGVAHWRPVVLGDIVRATVLVEEGLAEGDVVVTVGHHDLVDGDKVIVAREGWCCEDGRAAFDAGTASAAN